MFGFLKKSLVARPPAARAAPPVPVDAETYATQLAAILSQHTYHGASQIRAALANLPPKTRDMHIGIHPGQDGAGMFSVMIHLGGPDIYVLNKAIKDHRYLFDIRYMDGRLNVSVPLFDPDEVAFCVNDVIADASVAWVRDLWAQAGRTHPDLPVMVFCEDDYGHTPVWLQGEPQ